MLLLQGGDPAQTSGHNALIDALFLPPACYAALNNQTLQYLKSLFDLTRKKHVICMRTCKPDRFLQKLHPDADRGPLILRTRLIRQAQQGLELKHETGFM